MIGITVTSKKVLFSIEETEALLMAQEERMEKHIKVEALVPCKANFSQGFNSDRCGCSSSPNRFNFHGRGGGRFPYSGRNH